MSKLVIELKFPGLGDHLFHSHVPRIAKEIGAYHQVLYSLRSVVRSQEIVDLVWKPNPYIDGYVDEPGTKLSVLPKLENGNVLDMVMTQYGLDDGRRYHDPEIYKMVEINNAYRDLIVYDPNYVSFVGAVDVDCIREHFKSIDLSEVRQMKLRNRCYPLSLPVRNIRAQSLLEYCQIVLSCKDFYCLASGSATLAAALKKPSTVFYGFGQKPIFHHSRQHTYVLASSGDIFARTRAYALRMRRCLLPD